MEAQLFGRDEFRQLIEKEILLVAAVDGQIVAYAMAASERFFGKQGFYGRFFSRALRCGPDAGRKIQKLGCYGPVWVAPAFRGKGIFTPLTAALFDACRARFDTLATFIAEENEHSLNVHVKAAGMQVVDFFEDEGRGFYLLLK
nr:GNAT family N-acetyltransferase [Shewanella jiangmenensis]